MFATRKTRRIVPTSIDGSEKHTTIEVRLGTIEGVISNGAVRASIQERKRL